MGDIGGRLTSLVLGATPAAQHAARSLGEDGAWGQVVRLAGLWRIIPRLRQRLRALEVSIATAAAQQLREASLAAAMQSTALAHRGAEVLDRLAAAQIPALAFKGLGVIAALYDGPGDRMVSDVDVLIEERHVHEACRVLEALGFTAITSELDAFVDYLDRRPLEGAGSGNYFRVFIDAERLEVDLHWRLGTRPAAGLDAAQLIRRAETATLYGRILRVAAPGDAILLTVHHALRSNFVPASTVKDLIDLAHWWRVQPERWGIDAVIDQARAAQLGVPLLALWQILSGFDATAPAAWGVARLATVLSPAERRDADRLRDLFHLQLRDGNVNTDLLQLLSLGTLRRFISRRLRYTAATRQIDHQIEQALELQRRQTAAQRLSALLGDVTRLTPRALRAYRALLRAHGFRRTR